MSETRQISAKNRITIGEINLKTDYLVGKPSKISGFFVAKIKPWALNDFSGWAQKLNLSEVERSRQERKPFCLELSCNYI